MKKIYLLHSGSEIEIFYTLFPFILNNNIDAQFIFKRYNPSIIDHLSGETVLFTRIFKKKFDNLEYIRSTIETTKKNFDYVYFLDDSAGSDSTHFEFTDLIDGYFKAKLLQNTHLYSKEMYGRQVFSDYYHRKFNVTDEIEDIRPPVSNPALIDKLRPAFNLGYGIYPKPATKTFIKFCGNTLFKINKPDLLKPLFMFWRKKMITDLGKKISYEKKTNKVSARFRYNAYPNSIGYQRKLFESLLLDRDQFLTGVVAKDKYEEELQNVLITLSPFGYGEVCFRDFESIMNGSLLLKPDMSHLKTNPDIYQPFKTYVPLEWDGSDLIEKVDDILSNPNQYYDIIENSRKVYRRSLIEMQDHFFDTFKTLLNSSLS